MVDSIKNKDLRELKPRIVVMGVGGAGGNALNNMVAGGLMGVEFIAANTDAQALLTSKAEKVIQIGAQLTEGLGAGSRAEIGAAAAEEAAEEIRSMLDGAHMVFVTAGMGGGTGSGAAPVISRIARGLGILTVGVVTKPFQFEGLTRMNTAEKAITRLRDNVDTLIVIPNQNLFRITNEQTTFSDAFAMADKVLHSGIACITDLMVKEGLINLDFADVKIVMSNMGKSMMGSGIASGENRGREAAEIAITNPLLDDVTLEGAKGVLISIIGGKDLTLFEVEQAAETIRKVVDVNANIIVGATFDEARKGDVLVSVLATGLGGDVGSAVQIKNGIANDVIARDVVMPVENTLPEIVAFDDISVIAEESPLAQNLDNGIVVHSESLLLNLESESDTEETKAVKTDWVSDEDVTIQPINYQKETGVEVATVAKKVQDNDQVKTQATAPFLPLPVPNSPASSRLIPGIDEFSPIAQKALKAQKQGEIQAENASGSLFARLSSLGKKFTGSDGKVASESEIYEKIEPEIVLTEKAEESSVDSGFHVEVAVPVGMKMTAEEEMEIPSFFKRKKTG